MKLIFFKNLSLNNVVNKELTSPLLTTTFFQKDDFSISNPILLLTNIDSSLIANYCYIEDLNRYYFIKDIEILKSNFIKLSLETDYLMTFKNLILSSHGVVKESKTLNDYNSDYDVTDEMQSKIIAFPNKVFADSDSLYLVIAN